MEQHGRYCGIDPGSHALKLACVVQPPGSKGIWLEHATALAPSDAEQKGLSTEGLSSALPELCEASGLSLSGTPAAISLPTFVGVVQQVQLPGLSSRELRAALSLEMSRLLSFPVEEAVGDYLPLARRTGADGDRTDQGYLLVAARHEVVRAVVAGIGEANLRPVVVEPEPSTLYRLAEMLNPEAESGPRVLIDLGATGTRLLIVQGDELLLFRDISVGGRHFTTALAEALQTGPENAEALKLTEFQKASDLKSFGAAGERLLSELQRSLRYVEASHHLAGYSALHLVGGGARWPALRKRVQSAVGAEARDELVTSAGVLDPAVAKVVALALWHAGRELAGPQKGLRCKLRRALAMARGWAWWKA